MRCGGWLDLALVLYSPSVVEQRLIEELRKIATRDNESEKYRSVNEREVQASPSSNLESVHATHTEAKSGSTIKSHFRLTRFSSSAV